MLLTKRHYLMIGGSVVAAAALTLAATTLPNRSEPVTLPENTAIHVTLDQAVSSNRSNPGDHFEATVRTVAWATGHKDIKLAPETPVTFKLADPLIIKVKS